MRSLAPVRWGEGMFLKPHHFQQADLYQDARLRYHLLVANPFHWGIVRLRVDVPALENMRFNVLECEALMPDGVVIRFPQDAVVESRSFQDEFPATQATLDVHLAMRNIGADDENKDRWVKEAESRRDLLLRDNVAQVEVLVPKAFVVFGGGKLEERLAGSLAIKIAEIRRTGRDAPRFELSSQYLAPAFTVHALPRLVAMTTEVLERLCSASRTLGAHRRERGPEAIGYGVGDLEQLLARQVVNQSIPILQHALANERVHPWGVYGLLAQLHGALTSFWPEGEAWAFPPYQHDDLANCFGPLTDAIRQLLERLLPVHYKEILLVRDKFQFSSPVEEDLFARGNTFVLALKASVGEEILRQRVEAHAKISSTQDMPQLVRSALRGVPLRFLPVPPAEIPRYAGHLYFQIDINEQRWAKVKDAATFAFYLADAEPDLEARLFVVLGNRPKA